MCIFKYSIFVFALIMTLFIIMPLRDAMAQDEGRASVKLPLAVTIISYEDSKKICGADNPPGWCPAHMLKTARTEQQTNSFSEYALSSGHTDIDRSELAKRQRIQSIKERLQQQRKTDGR